MPALIISIVGFVESISVAQTLAAKRRERIEPNQELIGLGAANLAAAVGGGYPVTGGFARSVVNFDAGAATPAAGAFTAIGIAGATLLLTPMLAVLPKATLAATIVIAVLTLVDFSILKRAWSYSNADFAAVAITLGGTLALGVETGIALGVGASILIFLYRSSNPHAAIVGQVPGTEHFRNVKRHDVETAPGRAVDPHRREPLLRQLKVDDQARFQRRLAAVLCNCIFIRSGRTTSFTSPVESCPESIPFLAGRVKSQGREGSPLRRSRSRFSFLYCRPTACRLRKRYGRNDGQ